MVFLVVSACSTSVEEAEPPAPDRCAFERDVYPILARDCGFSACHGSTERFFRLWGPGRTRLDANTPFYDPVTSAEIQASYDRVRSMLVHSGDIETALLLRKPLEGSAHQGIDDFRRNVYRNRDNPSWQTLAAWARGESAPCP